jgi:hypothetical protein
VAFFSFIPITMVKFMSPEFTQQMGANTQKQKQAEWTKTEYNNSFAKGSAMLLKPSKWPLVALAKGTYDDALKAQTKLRGLVSAVKPNPGEGDRNELNAAIGEFSGLVDQQYGWLDNANAGRYNYAYNKWEGGKADEKNNFSDYSIEFIELNIIGSAVDKAGLIAALSLKEHMTSKGFTRWDALKEADPNITSVKIKWKYHGVEKTQEFKKDEAIKLQIPIDAVYGDTLEMKTEESADCKTKNKDYPYKITNSRKQTTPAYAGGKDEKPAGVSFCGNSKGEQAPGDSVKTEVFPVIITSDTGSSLCVGAWGDWSACANGTQNRSYKMTSGTASECPAPETQNCGTACEGEWEEDSSECIDGKLTKMYSIKTKATGGGKECSNVEGDTMMTDCIPEDPETPSWVWWAVGGGGVLLCFCIVFLLIFVLK